MPRTTLLSLTPLSGPLGLLSLRSARASVRPAGYSFLMTASEALESELGLNPALDIHK